MKMQRRAMRLLQPGTQLRLGFYMLGATIGFGVLFAMNSMAAYENFYKAMMTMISKPFQEEILAQTVNYLRVSAALIAFYVLLILGLSMAFVYRLIGPTIALDRHVRALLSGNYSGRVALRGGDVVFADLTRHLNALTERLEKSESHHR